MSLAETVETEPERYTPEGFRWTEPRRAVWDVLAAHGGEVRDVKRGAPGIVADELGLPVEPVKRRKLYGVIDGMARDGVLEKDMVHPRLCGTIRLVGFRTQLRAVPDAASVAGDGLAGTPRPPAGPEGPPVAPAATEAPVPPASPSLVPEGVDYAALGVAVLEAALATVEAHDAVILNETIDALKIRLGEAVDTSQRALRKVGELSDELAAVKRERDGLRAKLTTCEANLKAAVQGGSVIVDREVRERVARFMRETPNANASRSDG